MDKGINTRVPPWLALIRSDTGRAAGFASAVIAANVLALVYTIVFARMLGAAGYGSLAALMSAFIILAVPGSALQIAVAREVSRGGAGSGSGVRGWIRHILVGTAFVAVAALPLRGLIGAALNVDELWAAAALPASAALWMVVSVQRGALQGMGRYRAVALSIIGETAGRLVVGVALISAGLDVSGAFLAVPLTLALVALVLARPLLAALPGAVAARPLRELLSSARVPVIGLTLLFALQEVHVIVVKHEVSDELAGSYGVAAVAAKAIIWVAVGLGMYLLPEASRRTAAGLGALPILVRTLALLGLAAVPMLALYSFAAKPLLAAVFGDTLTAAAGALPWLGLAMTLLACAYLAVQYMLALGRSVFAWMLGVAAVAEVAVLASVGADLETVAIALAAVQLLCAAGVLSLSLRAPPASLPRGPATPVPTTE